MRRIKKIGLILLAVLSSLLISCTKASENENNLTNADFVDMEFEDSNFKHINNGGIVAEDGLPYQIDAITGATVTVEGPAVKTSIPLSVRELENKNDAIVRRIYTDSTGTFIYEGLDLYYLLFEMTDGDNGIFLTENADSVALKNHDRENIAVIKIADVKAAHEANEPIIIAYGKGSLDGEVVAPFVYDGENEEAVSLGYIEELDNDNGCLKLVYDTEKYCLESEYKTFENVAYFYIQEELTPGFKHTSSKNPEFSSKKYTDYILTFRGEALGGEFNLTVEQLENLVKYDENDNVIAGGIGYSDKYSLANNAYWYVNEYEGLDLYKLLQFLGMKNAEEMGRASSRSTLVKFVAADGHRSNEVFSIETLSYPQAFGFYQKNAIDMNDGSYTSTNEDIVKLGYPVLLAYGVNSYPYTVSNFDEGFLSGLANSGGPMRVVFGKTQYYHANGSNQVQYLSEILVGEDVLYNTHKYTENADLNALSDEKFAIKMTNSQGETLTEKNVSVGEIEDIIYGSEVDFQTKKSAKVKNIYDDKNIYEGIDLRYFFKEYIEVLGTVGTVKFTSKNGDILECDLAEILNSEAELTPIIAFAKNGTPLVENSSSLGYKEASYLVPFAESDPAEYIIKNSGGPLKIIMPEGVLESVVSVEIALEQDAYSHKNAPYNELNSSQIKFFGEGLEGEISYTLSDIENMQIIAKTFDFCDINEENELFEERFRGVPIYDILMKIGLKNNAADVILTGENDEEITVTISDLKKYVANQLDESKSKTTALLAFGASNVQKNVKDGLPLVENENSDGFVAEYNNDGGPFMAVLPQSQEQEGNIFAKNLKSVEVTANDIETWGHAMGDIYSEFLDYQFEFVVKNEKNEWREFFTVADLEAQTDLIVRDNYSVLELGECEGIDIWNFVKLIAGELEGVKNPVSVTVYADDGYKNDLLGTYSLDQLENGVIDANGDRKPLIIAYAMRGYPLVDSETHEGYTGLAGNASGPLRVIAENVQGASVKYFNKIVITIEGEEEIDINYDILGE